MTPRCRRLRRPRPLHMSNPRECVPCSARRWMRSPSPGCPSGHQSQICLAVVRYARAHRVAWTVSRNRTAAAKNMALAHSCQGDTDTPTDSVTIEAVRENPARNGAATVPIMLRASGIPNRVGTSHRLLRRSRHACVSGSVIFHPQFERRTMWLEEAALQTAWTLRAEGATQCSVQRTSATLRGARLVALPAAERRPFLDHARSLEMSGEGNGGTVRLQSAECDRGRRRLGPAVAATVSTVACTRARRGSPRTTSSSSWAAQN